MRKTKRLHSRICHQSGLPKHYRKSVMSWSFTEGLAYAIHLESRCDHEILPESRRVRLTTTDILKPYKKQESMRLVAVGWDRMANWILFDAPWGAGAPDNILWEQFNRGIAGGINTRGVRFVRTEEGK